MKEGDKVTWLHTPRGGYGYTIPVNAEIVKVNPKTVFIRVARTTGELVYRSVKPESLRPREPRS